MLYVYYIIIPVPATVYSLENVEIKDKTCRENFVWKNAKYEKKSQKQR